MTFARGNSGERGGRRVPPGATGSRLGRWALDGHRRSFRGVGEGGGVVREDGRAVSRGLIVVGHKAGKTLA